MKQTPGRDLLAALMVATGFFLAVAAIAYMLWDVFTMTPKP